MDNLSIYEIFSKEMSRTKLPVLISLSPRRRTKSICKNPDPRFILSNSIDESIPHASIRTPRYPKQSGLLNFPKALPIELELRKAIKSIISHKPKIKGSQNRKVTTTFAMYSIKNYEEVDVTNFIKSMFSHEPSPFRKVGLTAEPKAMDLRHAEKILQDAKKIIKHGVIKKLNQQENKTQIEDFWKQHISKEEWVRWDVFEEALLSFLENFMVCNYGVIRKVNWKVLFGRLFAKIGLESGEYEIWPAALGKKEKMLAKVVGFSDFARYISEGNLHKLMIGCIEELPFYIENLRKGSVYTYTCGCYYKGEWKDGKREGNGVFEMCSGDSYFGNFVRGLRDEFGTLKGKGYLYKGDFKKDKFNGYGVMNFPDGSVFDGMWIRNYFLKGKYEFEDGSYYVGDWNNQEFEGRGKLVLADGGVKKGMWRNSKLCGDGYVKEPDGKITKGFFLEDVYQSEDQGR